MVLGFELTGRWYRQLVAGDGETVKGGTSLRLTFELMGVGPDFDIGHLSCFEEGRTERAGSGDALYISAFTRSASVKARLSTESSQDEGAWPGSYDKR